MKNRNYDINYGNFAETTGITINITGPDILRYNFINKGTAFAENERNHLKLTGYLPPRIKTLEDQVKASLEIIEDKKNDIERFIYIRSLFDRNVVLAHAVIATDITRFLSIIYTPTVGQACQQYSSMFRTANGIHLHPRNIDRAEDILKNYSDNDIRVAVVTDNQGILGIGDQGAGGIAICLGKLMLYTQGAGIAPWHCLPISLDVGTDNLKLLKDPSYIGYKHERLKDDDYLKFIEKFSKAFKKVFPNALCQWEDFSKQNAFTIRDAYLHDLISFNDDVQGTGSVALAGIIASMKIKKENLKDQVFLVHGAGAGGIGIAEQIHTELMANGLSKDQANQKIFTLDSKGIVTSDRKLERYKEKFAKNIDTISWLKKPEDNTLLNTIINEKITVLLGTSGQPGCFTKEIVEAVSKNTKRPVILPLSNPTVKSEALPEDIYKWTKGNALVATGSPFAPVMHNGKKYRIGQMNNAFIFPGVGLGIIASGAKQVLPTFFSASAHAVAEYITEEEIKDGILCPPLEKLRDVSIKVAKYVGAEAIKGGVCGEDCAFSDFQHKNDTERLDVIIEGMCWNPKYFSVL
ncbi:MAG: NAD-dependent malic enzyme [Desulfobacteraceae bacterium]|nr:NAD-dependent malic enzyme [Desulfobacteraceae bacterium]